MYTFGKRLRMIRMKRGYTQQHLSDLLGISLVTYQKYEQAERFPISENLVNIGEVLDVSIDWLLGRDDFLKSLGVSVDEYL